jgi:ABC-type glycerol-3-phosphate transport system permease component
MRRQTTFVSVLSQVATYGILGTTAFLMAFPFYWMVVTTLKPAAEVYTTEIGLIPSTLTLFMYRKLLSDPQLPVVRFFFNSAIISLGATLVCVVTATLAAYPLSRRKVPGGKLAYFLIIATMMVPGEVVLIGIFMVVNAFNMVNTYQGMIFPLAVNAVTFLIIYNYVLQLPKEMDEAALVDGASIWQVLWHIIIPLAQPAIYSATLLAFLSAWQNFTIPYLLTQSNNMYPLSVGALFTETTLYATMQETLSLSTILTIPTLLVFVLTQRFVFSGITTGAIKG